MKDETGGIAIEESVGSNTKNVFILVENNKYKK